MSQDKQNQLQQMAENLQFRVKTIPNGKIWLTEIHYPFFTFNFDNTSEMENFLRKESSGFKERTGSENISQECPFCYAFLGLDGCCHRIVNMCFDVPPIWSNGFEVLETILMYYESYDCGAAHEGFFDWRECLYKLSLEKVVEKNGLSELDPTELFGLLDGVEIVTNLRTGDMTTGYFFYACVSDDKRDFWLKEFKILSNRIESRFLAEDWEGQPRERITMTKKAKKSSQKQSNEPEYPLEKMARELEEEFRASGIEVTDAEPIPPGQFIATFVPRQKATPATRPPKESQTD